MPNLVKNPEFSPTFSPAGGPIQIPGTHPEYVHSWHTRHNPAGSGKNGAQTVAYWWWTWLNDTCGTIETELIPTYPGNNGTANVMRVTLTNKDGGITSTFPVPNGISQLTAKVWVSLIEGEIVLQAGDPGALSSGNVLNYNANEGWKQLSVTNTVKQAPGNDGQILLYSTASTGATFYVAAPEVIGIP